MGTYPALQLARDTSLKEFTCPSNNNQLFVNPTSNPPQMALTNYKAMGATTLNSLAVAQNGSSATPPYGTISLHPDGAIYPSGNNIPIAALSDGTSHTIIVMETIDDIGSRWMYGAECTLTGVPASSGPVAPVSPYTYFAPPKYDGTFGDTSAVSVNNERTFLMYDFTPAGADVGTYKTQGDPNFVKGGGDSSGQQPNYGPSSAHPAVAIVGMGDGSVQSLSKRCDAANLCFLITKNGAEPFNIP
jgi:hypothetical protein